MLWIVGVILSVLAALMVYGYTIFEKGPEILPRREKIKLFLRYAFHPRFVGIGILFLLIGLYMTAKSKWEGLKTA